MYNHCDMIVYITCWEANTHIYGSVDAVYYHLSNAPYYTSVNECSTFRIAAYVCNVPVQDSTDVIENRIKGDFHLHGKYRVAYVSRPFHRVEAILLLREKRME